jgi:hypothetical protein
MPAFLTNLGSCSVKNSTIHGCRVGLRSSAAPAALPAFVRYDGRDGLRTKQAAGEEWAAQAAARPSTAIWFDLKEEK